MKYKKPFALAVFLGAFLLFQIQPIMGKYLLPWFGGAPAVWTACLLFFQLFLLGGYMYAHFLHRFEPRRQGIVHGALLLCALALGAVLFHKWGNPILPAASLKPIESSYPTWEIIFLLSCSIGLAYFLLSASTSLLQAWFHLVVPSKSPYFFYGISNTAALLALLSYPFVFEALLTTRMQALLWSGGFLIYAGVCASCALKIRGASRPDHSKQEKKSKSAKEIPDMKDFVLWTALAACGVLALMSVTNQMTQELPPVPLLWILALALYLLSYVIGFMERLRKWQGLYMLLLILSGIMAGTLIHYKSKYNTFQEIAAYSFILFSVCLFCHNALYRIKPHPRHLTGFYLCLSLGGVLGGLFVAIIAPLIFSRYWEYQLALVMAMTFAVVFLYRNRKSVFYKIRHAGWLLVILLAISISSRPDKDGLEILNESRNFFGTFGIVKRHRMKPIETSYYVLFHGQTMHGAQYKEPVAASKFPSAYFTAKSGVGQSILAHPKRISNESMRVGIVGLGIGTLAAYGRKDDVYRIYEINPAIIEIACSSHYFSYIRDSAADIEIVPGDARIQLEQELRLSGSQQFDILVLDAFNSDSVPAHLLTKEAFALYLNHLSPTGLLAVHVSSRYLDLVSLMRAVQDECNLPGVFIRHVADDGFSLTSKWVVFSRERKNLPKMRWVSPLWDKCKPICAWTDDFSNLFSIIKP